MKLHIREVIPVLREPVEQLGRLRECRQVLRDLVVPRIVLRQDLAAFDLADGLAQVLELSHAVIGLGGFEIARGVEVDFVLN